GQEAYPTKFFMAYLVGTWGLMVLLPKTGASLHHVILLWPFPHLLIAVVASQLSRGFGKIGLRVVTGTVSVLAGINLLVVNHCYADLVTRGTTTVWTDAVYPLFDYLDSQSHKTIITVDWGYSTTLCLLSDGQAHLDDLSFGLLQPTAEEALRI